jgi:hypothetical protein
MFISGKNQWFWGVFPLEGIASDATWMYYVKTKKPLPTTRAVPEVPILNMFRYGHKAKISTIVSTVSILLNVANIKILQRMIEIG